MAEAVIFEFSELTPDQYRAINSQLGLDAATGEGDWPSGLLSHTGGATEGGGLVVFEVWDSRESEAAFMQSRLGPAFAGTGAPAPSRVEWLTLVGRYDR
jgi:hypothetical protein